MNHCSFYCKQSLSISHLEMIYLDRTRSYVTMFMTQRIRICKNYASGARDTGTRCVTRDMRDIGQSTRCYVSVTSHVTRDVRCHAACHNPSHPSIVLNIFLFRGQCKGKFTEFVTRDNFWELVLVLIEFIGALRNGRAFKSPLTLILAKENKKQDSKFNETFWFFSAL